MLFQSDLFLIRAFISLSVQLVGGIIGIYLGTKLIKRRKNKITVSLGMLYYLSGSAYLVLAIFILILIDPITFISYLVAYNLAWCGYMLTVIFNSNLLNPKNKAFSVWQFFYMVSYMIGINLLLLIPNSAKLDASTNWISVFGQEFSIALMIYYSITVSIPGVYLMFKVLKRVRENMIKRRVRLFLIGNLWFMITVYGQVVYIAMPENLLYRSIWVVTTFFNIVPLLLIYYGTKEI